MYGYWIYFAIGNFVLIGCALAWGIFSQVSQRATTFAEDRESIFAQYSHRKVKELLSFQKAHELSPQTSALRQTFLKPFNSQAGW